MMISAEQWKQTPAVQRQHVDAADIREIQLDAYKQGMTDAAMIVEKTGAGFSVKRPHTLFVQAILTARDNKKEL